MTILAPNIKSLIKSHGGSLPLASLVSCYEAEFEPMIVNNDEGVPLEHLGNTKGCVIVALQGCVIVALQGCVIVALQGCVLLCCKVACLLCCKVACLLRCIVA
jgi:hypothetical protein